jgi:arabinogalactan endo-1,4-beta-galactosidase
MLTLNCLEKTDTTSLTVSTTLFRSPNVSTTKDTVSISITISATTGRILASEWLAQHHRCLRKLTRLLSSRQATPGEWPTTLDPLAETLRQYVCSTLKAFQAAGIDLALVSLGNEIRHGMLWPSGYVDVDTMPTSARVANFSNFADLWAAARQGVNDAVSDGVTQPQVMVHIDDGWNTTLQTTWFEAFTANGKVSTSDWDVFGFSVYPFYGTAATLPNLQTTLNTLASKYGKPLHVVETDWPDICSNTSDNTAPTLSDQSIPISVGGQIEWVHDIIEVLKSVPGGLGQGINYWEPAWLNNTGLGSACQDTILFSADWSAYPKVTGYSRASVNMYQGV